MKNGKTKELCALFSALGLWLIAAPYTFGYESHALSMSDHLSGIFLLLTAIFTLLFDKKLLYWVPVVLGVWLQFAPLLFWAPEPVSYANDTLVGIVLIALAFQLPNMQKVAENASIPKGWSFNPSGWTPRVCTSFLAIICWFLARYLSAFQLGYIDTVWDPFFGTETVQVLTSSVADVFPVSDAGLGAMGYTLEALLGWLGGTARWKNMPWLVIAFGFLVVPAGLTSILLIIMQPVIVGAWCGLCLIIALRMLIMATITVPELVATMQLLAASKKKKSFWKTFFLGDQGKTESAPKKESSFFGVSFSWRLAICALLGIWLMTAPYLLHIGGTLSFVDYICGPLIVTISVLSMAEVVRSLRLVNVGFAIVLLISPWSFTHESASFVFSDILTAFLLIFLSLPKGKLQPVQGKR